MRTTNLTQPIKIKSNSQTSKRLSSKYDYFCKDIMTKEEFDNFIKELDKETQKIISENEAMNVRAKRLEAQTAKKMKKALTESIEALIEQGQAVPAKLINKLRSLK